MSGGEGEKDLYAARRAYQARQASDHAQQRDLSTTFRHRSDRNTSETHHTRNLRPMKSQATFSSDQDIHRTHTLHSYSDASEGRILE